MIYCIEAGGRLSEIKHKKPTTKICLFPYKIGDDILRVDGCCIPVIFDNEDSLSSYLDSPQGHKDIKFWAKNHYTIVIRQVEIQ